MEKIIQDSTKKEMKQTTAHKLDYEHRDKNTISKYGWFWKE